MLNAEILSEDIKSKFISLGAVEIDAVGNRTNLNNACDILANTIIDHFKGFGQITINTSLVGTVVGVGGGVPGPVSGTATIPSGVLLPNCIQ
jgi:hypothetical protein